jgi:triosephosphate isomerase (TIM)
MLSLLGIKYAIVGHSERRTMGESNNEINKKIKALLSVGIVPIVCIGENKRDENHQYFNVVKTQLKECLSNLPKGLISKTIVVYEPVWSISTSLEHHNAKGKDINEMTIFIRKIISDIYSSDIAKKVRMLYGGSVNEKNVLEFLSSNLIEGFLIGGASLDSKKFNKIVQIVENFK